MVHFLWESHTNRKALYFCILDGWGGLGFTVYGCLNSAYMGGIASALSLFVFCLFFEVSFAELFTNTTY